MINFIIGGVALIGGYYLLKEEKPQEDLEKANLHDAFLAFEEKITVPVSKITKLRTARQALELCIVEHFRQKEGVTIPKFYIQGSYKMKTMILDNSSTYDVDLGIYFLKEPTVTAETLQKWVVEAVKEHTTGGVKHKEKCLRVVYQGDFHIDLPVYYKTDDDENPYLATKKGSWMKSDPKELCDWFANKKDANGQLIRLVKYFKAWAKNRSRKMPSGIALTVLAVNKYRANDRDDLAFYETASAILNSFPSNFWGTKKISCVNPGAPGDDLLDRLNSDQKDRFYNALKELVHDGGQAINNSDTSTASNIWRQQLGNKF